MKTALFIHSYAAANENVRRLWEYYKRSGWDIFGVSRINTKCKWPENIPTKDIGVDAYIKGSNLPQRMVDTYDWFVTDHRFDDYQYACIIEHDGIFIKAPPEPMAEAMGHWAGGPVSPNLAGGFYHCPWWLERSTAQRFVECGNKLIKQGSYENGNPDFFFAWVLEHLGVQPKNLDGTYSRNSLDIGSDRDQCRDMIRKNTLWFVHGVKTEEQLHYIFS